MMILMLKTAFGALEVFAGLFLATSIFRIPYRSYFLELASISIFISVINTLNIDVLKIPFIYAECIAFFLVLLLLFWLIKLSAWHSFLLFSIGYISGEILTGIIVSSVAIVTPMPVTAAMDIYGFTLLFQSIKFIVAIYIGLILYSRKIGFVFVSDKLNYKPSLKRVNVVIIATVIISFFISLIGIFIVSADMIGAIHGLFVSIVMLVFFVLSLWVVCIRISRLNKDHYENIDVNELFK